MLPQTTDRLGLYLRRHHAAAIMTRGRGSARTGSIMLFLARYRRPGTQRRGRRDEKLREPC